MKNFTIYLALLCCLLASKTIAQESPKSEQPKPTFESRAKAIADKIEKITQDEKELLKKEVEEVNVQLEKGTITKEQADDKKQKLAQARATIIENKVALTQEELRDLIQQKVDGKIASSFNQTEKTKDSVVFEGKNYKITYKITDSTYIDINGIKKSIGRKKRLGEKRTTTQFVFAMGLNNLATNGDVENSDYRFLGSHFYEWGWTYNTRISKTDNLLHFKYGWSVMYNNLRPTDNRYFVKNGSQTNLQVNPIELKDSRFRSVYLVLPLHLEFDFSGKKEKDGKPYFRSHKSFRFGLGGYGGIRLKSKQLLCYEIDGDRETEKIKADFNASNFIYGLSGYIGYKQTSLYVKYDLNPMFQNNTVKQNNVSLGIRWDFN